MEFIKNESPKIKNNYIIYFFKSYHKHSCSPWRFNKKMILTHSYLLMYMILVEELRFIQVLMSF